MKVPNFIKRFLMCSVPVAAVSIATMSVPTAWAEGASGNNVTLSGEVVTGGVEGGSSYNDTVKNNHVTITDGTQVTGAVDGGFSISGSAEDNHVTITNKAQVKGGVSGGFSMNGSAVNNTVTITGDAIVNANVEGIVGGYVSEFGAGVATGNHVTISGGATITTNFVQGGFSCDNDATHNSVTLDGAVFTSATNVYGGYSGVASAATTNNTVTLRSGDYSNVTIYGGNREDVTGNKLALDNCTGTLGNVNKFDTIEQEGGYVTLLGGDLKAAGTIQVQGSAESAATLTSAVADGHLHVSATKGVTIDNANVYASGTVSVTSEGDIKLSNSTVGGSMIELNGAKLENVVVSVAQGGTANLCNSELSGGTVVSLAPSAAALTFISTTPDATTVLLDGCTVKLDTGNTVITGEKGSYTLDASGLFVGVEVSGDFTLDVTALAETVGNFESLNITLGDQSSSFADSGSNMTLSLNGQQYSSTQKDGSGIAFQVSSDSIPEPGTATLSLVALAGLAARRRRK